MMIPYTNPSFQASVAGFGRYKHISSCCWYRSPATYPAALEALEVELKRKATPSVHTKIATHRSTYMDVHPPKNADRN
jgi:hypothetical protein